MKKKMTGVLQECFNFFCIFETLESTILFNPGSALVRVQYSFIFMHHFSQMSLVAYLI